MDPEKDLREPSHPSISTNHSPHQSKGEGFNRLSSSKWQKLISNLFLAALLVFIFTATFKPAFLIQSYQVDGQSMAPTLQNNDRLIVNKLPRSVAHLTKHPYIPHRGDIIIFNQAGLDFNPNYQKQLIKRAIGLPGERLVVKDGTITVYSKVHPEGFNPDKAGLYQLSAPRTPGNVEISLNSLQTPGNVDITLKSDQIFVVGDNRTNSEDSRYFGPVTVDKILGKLVLRILPINKAHGF